MKPDRGSDHETAFERTKRLLGRGIPNGELNVSHLWIVINEQQSQISWLNSEIDRLMRRSADLQERVEALEFEDGDGDGDRFTH